MEENGRKIRFSSKNDPNADVNVRVHQESAFLVVLGSNKHMSPPPARRTATMNVGAGQYVSKSVAITTTK